MGPLRGVRIIEMGSIGPGPFAGMMLADMGADIIRLERRDALTPFPDPKYDVMLRGRRSVLLDVKKPEGAAAVLELVEKADALFEGFRPGRMESMGLGPDRCLARNPRLVYGRITGWGQEGPLADAAGHDINYTALAGALHAFGRQGQPPTPPLNLVGDFGGGGMLLALGVVAALFEAQRSGKGQVVDAAMVDGIALQMALIHGFLACGLWQDQRGVNLLDSGAHFYETYETADGKWVAIGAIEPKFYTHMLRRAGIDDPELEIQFDPRRWPELKAKLADIFSRKTREQWCEILEGSDACFAPVLSMAEAPGHAHNRARHTFVELGGVTQAAPAPRFSRTPGEINSPPPKPGEHTESALLEWGLSEQRLASLKRAALI